MYNNNKEGYMTKNGMLYSIGHGKIGIIHGYEFFKCKDCKTIYPKINGVIMCNGHYIVKCPWCREDSEPWKNGRGI